MPQKFTDTTIAHHTELAIRRIGSLSTLPSVATQFLSRLFQSQPASALAEIIESDPALTVMTFSLAGRQALNLTDTGFSMHRILDKLPTELVRQAFFSVKIFHVAGADDATTILSRQLIRHCLAVACCAKEIARAASLDVDPHLAYSAGLLHDIGKLALCQVMPKSFARIVEEAKSQKACLCRIEQQHLGIDHAILGKRLAQKWHLPRQIALAVWLHHTDTAVISQRIPEAKIAQIVQMADLIARQCAIGQSGSYHRGDLQDQAAQMISITAEQIEQIRQNLTDAVEQKSRILGLDSPEAANSYLDTLNTAAAKLAKDSSKLSSENRRLRSASSHLDFITDFLLNFDTAADISQIAEDFAVRWQRFYQTGAVCLYLLPPSPQQSLQAIVVENLAQTKIVYLAPPADSPPIPHQAAKGFVILDAYDYLDWLFEQLDVDFEPNHTKLIPLLSGQRPIGAILFELRYPEDSELFSENFKAAASTGAAVLDMAFTSQDRQRFAEQFAVLIGHTTDRTGQTRKDPSWDALAEMAAGAAHELNDPLFVISGRAQLLNRSETDHEKKAILEQIRKNTGKLSDIIDGLMSFARPREPKPTQTSLKQILDEATNLAAQKTDMERFDIQVDIDDSIQNVFVDSAQIASAIANIFSNSMESYQDAPGPINVTADPDETASFVELQITDFGCGMDPDTIEKATQPFFSSRPAGRKRGMGLAHAKRLIQLNNGSLSIQSQPQSGTTVTILLLSKAQ